VQAEAISVGNALLDDARPRHPGNVPSSVIPLPGGKYELVFKGPSRLPFGYELACEVTNLRNGRRYTAKPTSHGPIMRLGMSDHYRVLVPDDFDGLELEPGRRYRWRWATVLLGYDDIGRIVAAGTFTI
jgi:hypothetical protein